MANVIKHKRGSGSDPAANNLVLGELAIRTDTGKLFTKMDSGAIAEIAGGGSDIAINTLSSSSGTGGGSATFNGSAYRFTLSAPPSVSAQQLLVSINGVIQKPVAGTGQPSEGFSVDGTDIILGDAPATGSDFFILTFKSLGVSEPADNSVTSAKIVDGAIVNADINASAAIAGTKINPNFGSQNISCSGIISTTGSLHVNQTNGSVFFGSGTGYGGNAGIGIASTNNFHVTGSSAGDMVIGAKGGERIVLGTNTTTNGVGLSRLIIKSDGTVDIAGNLDVGAGIDVTGAITSTGNLTITNTAPALVLVDSDHNSDFNIQASGGILAFNDSTNSATRLAINSSGIVTIGDDHTGAATLGADLAVANVAGANIVVGDTVSGEYLRLRGTSGAAWVGSKSNHPLIFFTNDTSNERMRIDTSGRLLLGTTTEGNNNGDELTIAKDSGNMGMTLRSGDSSNSHIYFSDATSGAGEYAGYIAYQHSDDSMHIGTNSAERIHIKSSGSVGIGTSSPSVKLHVNGGSGLLVERSTGTSVAGFKHTGATAMNIYFQNSGSTNHPSIGSSNQDLTLGTNNTERLRVLSGGGLTFNGDTAAANALDDYEEGTFTPDWKGGSALGSSITYGTTNAGSYTKIGRLVTVTGRTDITGGSGALGFWFCTNMPFVANSGGKGFNAVGSISLENNNFGDDVIDVVVTMEQNNNNMHIHGVRDNASLSNSISPSNDYDFSLQFTITYQTA